MDVNSIIYETANGRCEKCNSYKDGSGNCLKLTHKSFYKTFTYNNIMVENRIECGKKIHANNGVDTATGQRHFDCKHQE